MIAELCLLIECKLFNEALYASHIQKRVDCFSPVLGVAELFHCLTSHSVLVSIQITAPEKFEYRSTGHYLHTFCLFCVL